MINYFQYIVNPKNIKNGKPSPDIFFEACKGINIKPEEAMGFEDAMHGVTGLKKKANIKTVAVTWGDKDNWEIADLVYKSTKDFDFEIIMKL